MQGQAVRTIAYTREYYRAVKLERFNGGKWETWYVVESKNYNGQWSDREPGRRFFDLADCREYIAARLGGE